MLSMTWFWASSTWSSKPSPSIPAICLKTEFWQFPDLFLFSHSSGRCWCWCYSMWWSLSYRPFTSGSHLCCTTTKWDNNGSVVTFSIPIHRKTLPPNLQMTMTTKKCSWASVFCFGFCKFLNKFALFNTVYHKSTLCLRYCHHLHPSSSRVSTWKLRDYRFVVTPEENNTYKICIG